MTNEPQPYPASEPRLIPAVGDATRDLGAAITEEAREIASLASEQAHTLTEKLRDSAAEICDWATEGAETVKRAARGETAAVRDLIDRRAEQARDRVRSLEDQIEARIREKPLESVLIAVGVGIVIGWAARR